MKALNLKEYKEFEVVDIATPDIAADEVLVRVRAVGICGSDIHGMDGSSGRRIPPLVMGHEAAGVIEAVGAEVTDFQKGDRVTFDSTVYCGKCDFCREGSYNLCDNRMVLGVSCEDFRRNGAFAEYVNVPARITHRLPDELDFRKAAFAEPVSVALHAVNRVPVKDGDTALVVGAGIIGLLVIQALKIAGCSRVFAVDLDERRLEIAKQLGAEAGLVSGKDDVKAFIKERTGGRGADIAMEVVGFTPTTKLAVDCLRKGGSLGCVGNLAPSVDFPLQALVTREITAYGSCAINGEYPDALRHLANGTIDVEPIISKIAPLDEGADYFQRLYDNKEGLLKVILEP